ncbi:enoyl-CoA hydratase/isomerase family protein [Rhodococcus sp. USK10]|uniref:enoyl-CoA hydratase/isomerase family protein n=1 Tax=Rhodococcus sp. USK10 TaxID=2789739 RepID=UPI002151C389|nr:enoyl-CoA hydratase [Rhodococcus sp. USK10]
MPTNDPVILTETSGGVLTVTLNRPDKKNALNTEIYEALVALLTAVKRDPTVRVLVLRGAGDDFCAGGDLSEGLADDDHPLRYFDRIHEVPRLLHELPIPTIAEVSGAAFGAGWNLALCCDLVVASTDARFSQVFTKRGLSPDCGGSWLLPQIVGLQLAKRLVLLAEVLSAAEAERLGLVTFVAEKGQVGSLVAKLAQQLSASSPGALSQSKRLLNESVTQTLGASLADEGRAQTANLATDDSRIAFEAFLSRKQPSFTGRWSLHAQ